DAITCATAPLPAELAERAEQASGAIVIELFGATETCVIAHRRPSRTETWTLHEKVQLQACPDGTHVKAPWLAQPVQLADVLEQPDPDHFRLRGRQADLLEIAGKRASLADLTRRLRAIPGVRDAVVFQPDRHADATAHRLAALVVAPELEGSRILATLR